MYVYVCTMYLCIREKRRLLVTILEKVRGCFHFIPIFRFSLTSRSRTWISFLLKFLPLLPFIRFFRRPDLWRVYPEICMYNDLNLIYLHRYSIRYPTARLECVLLINFNWGVLLLKDYAPNHDLVFSVFITEFFICFLFISAFGLEIIYYLHRYLCNACM
jgi:hypothetical protein